MTPPAATSSKMPSKAAKTKVVVLKLSPAKLTTFPHTPASSAQSATKSTSTPGTPAPQVAEPTPIAGTPAESAATPAVANGTSTPSSTLAPPAGGAKRKSLPAPRGTKRGASQLGADGTPKPRGKPGPKTKKQRLGDMINDPNGKPISTAKLGPKANQGAINAGLRALDRTGKPCRKWQKKGFQIRSFTGVNWNVPTWRAPKNAAVFSEDVKSDSSSNANVKEESNSISDRSGLPAVSAVATPIPPAVNGLASSPAPAPVAAAS